MVSTIPSKQIMNRQMYNMQDLRGELPHKHYRYGSLMHVINENKNFSQFHNLIKIANLEDMYDDLRSDYTLFIPSKIDPAIMTSMDKNTARNLVLSNTLNRKIISDVLKDSPTSYFITKSQPNRLYVFNVNGKTYVNDDNTDILKEDIVAANGIIHEVSQLIFPQINV